MLDGNWEKSNILNNLGILSEYTDDRKLNSNNLAWKLPYICSSYHDESQMLIPFARRSSVFKIFQNWGFLIYSGAKMSKYTFLEFGRKSQPEHLHVGQCHHKASPRMNENCKIRSVLKFSVHALLSKETIKVLIFGRWPQKTISCISSSLAYSP